MKPYEFTCPDCHREIPVTDSMREAALTNGCPICGRSVAERNFAN
ncbi:zinc ribbon domain-containing protein [Natrinema sp. DC36]|nr:zinc ribbon domain-containing protein [Natrinema sp. DC36]